MIGIIFNPLVTQFQLLEVNKIILTLLFIYPTKNSSGAQSDIF